MKFRNQLLAVFCILLFAGIGVFYFNTWVVQKPFGIIVLLGDTLTGQTIAAARLYAGGAEERLAFDEVAAQVGLVRASASDYAVPDAAAGATAIATGQRAANRALAVDARGNALKSILEYAKETGRSVGIVTNGHLANAGLAPFFAHAGDGSDRDAVVAQLVDGLQPDVAFGGGAKLFLPSGKGGLRADDRDLILELKGRGDRVFRTMKELESAFPLGVGAAYGLFSDLEMPYTGTVEGAGLPALADLVRKAIQFLQFNRKGYVLIVDAALAGQALASNEGERALVETLALDAAFRTACDYAGEKSVVLVTGRASAGGLALNGFPLRQEHGLALTGVNAFGIPSLAWISGPGGKENEPVAFRAESAIPIASDFVLLARGPGVDGIGEYCDQTDLFAWLRGQL